MKLRSHDIAYKRNEFNEIAQRIRASLVKERIAANPVLHGPSDVDADQLEAALSWWRRRYFRKQWSAYRAAREQQTYNSYGGAIYLNADEFRNRIDSLLRFTETK